MFGYLTDEQFDLFKQRWDAADKGGMKSDIIESCTALANTGEFIPIIYSGGYEDIKETSRIKKMKVTTNTIFSRYILLGVKSGHTDIFTRFDTWRATLDFDDWQKTKPTLSTGMLNIGPYIPSLDRVYFNYWMLEFKYKLASKNQDRKTLATPPWLPRMWGELIKSITAEQYHE